MPMRSSDARGDGAWERRRLDIVVGTVFGVVVRLIRQRDGLVRFFRLLHHGQGEQETGEGIEELQDPISCLPLEVARRAMYLRKRVGVWRSEC